MSEEPEVPSTPKAEPVEGVSPKHTAESSIQRNRSENKVGVYATLNEGCVQFFKFMEKHAFPAALCWFLFIAVEGIWCFVQFLKEGEGFMTFVIGGTFIFLGAIFFWMDYQRAKSSNGSLIFFWKPWI